MTIKIKTKTEKCREHYISLLDKDLSILDVKSLEYLKKYSEYVAKRVQSQLELLDILSSGD